MFSMRSPRLLLLAVILFSSLTVSPNLAWEKINSTTAYSVSPVLGPRLNIWNDAVRNDNQAVVYNSDNDEYLVVWTSTQDEYSIDIWGRRISFDGTLLSWFCIANSPGEKFEYPVAAYSTHQHRYIVVFERPYINDPTDIDLWAVTFGYDGTDFSSPLVVDYSPSRSRSPSVVYNEIDDEFLVVYNNHKSSICSEVMARRLDAGTGSPVDITRPIGSCVSGEDRLLPDVAYSSDPASNNYLIIYNYSQTTPAHEYIYAKTASSDLLTLGPEFQLSGDNVMNFASLASGQNEYMVVWRNSNYDIYARRVNNDGTQPVPGNGFLISATALPATYSAFPEISSSKHGYWVVWDDSSVLPSTDHSIYGNFITMGTDQAQFADFPIDSEVIWEGNGRIACRWQGGCLVTDSYNLEWPAGDFEIRGRILYPFGIYLPLVVH